MVSVRPAIRKAGLGGGGAATGAACAQAIEEKPPPASAKAEVAPIEAMKVRLSM